MQRELQQRSLAPPSDVVLDILGRGLRLRLYPPWIFFVLFVSNPRGWVLEYFSLILCLVLGSYYSYLYLTSIYLFFQGLLQS